MSLRIFKNSSRTLIMATINQIKSKKRVADHGEVFTHEREVNAMLDLVKHETERIDSRFLEPACGSGNFLAEILRRKLKIVKNKYLKNQLDCERYSILALSSIYGVEILSDNAQECRDRLLEIFTSWHVSVFKKKTKSRVIEIAKFVLNKNIVCGDALSMKNESGGPLTLSEWSAVNGFMMKRRDFQYVELADFDPNKPTLFALREVSDTGEAIFSPQPVKDFALKHFLELDEDE